MRQKLISMLALLLMTATGAMADTETIATNQEQGSYTGTNITISVTDAGDDSGCQLNGPDGMTISTRNGDVITQMVLTIGWYSNQAGNVTASSGTCSVSGSGNGSTYVTITGINAPSVTIGSAYVYVQVSQVQVTYAAPVNVTANPDGEATPSYWSTFYNATQGYTADASTTVYKAALNGTSSVTLTEVTDREIPAGQAVILKSSAESITLTPASTTADLSDNVLKGGTTVTDDYDAYTLSRGSDGTGAVGFYKFSGSLDGSKAHLEIPTSAGSRGFIGFGDDNTTGIELPALADDEPGEWYSLDGRRLSGKPARKGIYVKDGQKYIIK